MKRRFLAASVSALALASAISTAVQAVTPTATVVRYSGADRYATSAAIVDANYTVGVPVVYIASGENFPDALAGGAAAARDGGPILLVRHGDVPPSVAAELSSLEPASIVILGGEASVTPAVQTALQAFTTGRVTRISGADRFATAAALAETFPLGTPVYVASGANYPDALAATAAAASQHAAIVLTSPGVLPPAAIAALTQLQPTSITVVGGTSAVSASVAAQLSAYSGSVVRVSGPDRYATAAAIAADAFPSATGVFVATGASFADALTGGPVAGMAGEPLLLATATCLPAATYTEVSALNPNTVTLLGGSASLGAGVQSLTKCAAAPAPLTPPAKALTFGNGVHQIGSTLPAGTYRTRSNSSGCYWARLSGFSGQLNDVIANNLSDFRVVVTIEPGDVGFESDNCATWTNDLSAVTATPTGPFGDGEYIVGTDIAAGTWTAPGGPFCYWQRESDFSGAFDSIIANDLGTTTPIVTIDPTDAGFTTEDCGTWTHT